MPSHKLNEKGNLYSAGYPLEQVLFLAFDLCRDGTKQNGTPGDYSFDIIEVYQVQPKSVLDFTLLQNYRSACFSP
jgi:hypothetical protein